MEAVFLKLLNMSITASWLILAVFVLRLLLKKAPRYISVILWAMVGVRLICPFSFESVLSLIPSAETVPQNIIYSNSPAIESGVPIINNTINQVITENLAPTPEASANPMQIIAFIATVVWILGVLVMIFYTVFSYLRIERKVREAVQYEGNVWLCDHVDTPFILGIVRPRIYLPSDISKQDMEYVIAHEKAHLKRRDHIWKPLGFMLLAVYWFNPVLWFAYILLCKDIEFACDEKVLKQMGSDIKKPYSDALINCSVPRKMISACPLAFGEVGVKGRIKSVLNYKKPAFWIVIVAIVTSIAVAVCFLTNPATKSETKLDADMQSFIEEQITERYSHESEPNQYCFADIKVLGTKKSKKTTTVYMWAFYSRYTEFNGEIEDGGGGYTRVVMTVKKSDSDSKYELVEYWEPTGGSSLTSSVKKKFPWYLHKKALDESHAKEQHENCDKKAREFFASDEYINKAYAYFLKSPPELAVSCGQIIVKAWEGGYKWKYTNPDTGIGTVTMADDFHPLKVLDSVPKLQIAPSVVSSANPRLASLQFTIEPDKIDVKCYKLDEQNVNNSEAISVQGNTFKMKEGYYLYEITARWSSSNVYSGSVTYAFQTTDRDFVAPDNTVITSKEAAKFIGKTVGDVKTVFGDNFKFGYYRGASSIEYVDEKVCFVLDKEYSELSDSCKISHILSKGDIFLIDNLNCNLTYSDLLEQLGSSVITEKPKYWLDEMQGYYKHTLIFIYKGCKIRYTWLQDPNTSKAFMVEAISPDNEYIKR